MIEISVKLKSDDATFTKKFTSYERDIMLNEHDPKLIDLVEQAVAEFKGQVEDVIIKITMVWK